MQTGRAILTCALHVHAIARLTPAPPTRNWRVVCGIVLTATLVIVTVAIWLRNHDILRDLYDYSTVIHAAGKIEAGFKPYTGVRSPMQTSVYYFNWLTEQVFGASYRGLTWGGLVQALGGGGLLMWLIARQWSFPAGVVVAAAVMLSGLIQHMVFFYNPIGILCLAIVLLGVAGKPDLWPPRRPEALIVLAALAIGGTNKINFQAFTLAMAGMLFLHAWGVRRITGRSLTLHLGGLFVAGVLVPVGFELAWTGASLREWLGDVVLRSSGRAGLIREVFSPASFLQPPRDFHHHILIRPMGGIGLLLLLTVGAWALTTAARERLYGSPWWMRLGFVLAGSAGSTLLMLSNNETVMLTSLGFLICSLALFLACRRPGVRVDLWVGRGVLVCAGFWVVGGAYSAWHASRVLYGSDPPPSSMFRRLRNAPRPLAYFEGVRFVRTELETMLDLATRLQAMEDPDGRLRGVLFGPAMEWLERAYPEAIIRGMPVWYDTETGLSEEDGPWFRQTLNEHGVDAIVTNPSWEFWPSTISHWFDVEFRSERAGAHVRLYHRRMPVSAAGESALPIPRTFRDATGSNVALGATQSSAGLALRTKPGGAYWSDSYWGANGHSTWDWLLPVGKFEGRAIVAGRLDSTHPTRVVFRIFALSDDAHELLWEHETTIDPGDCLVEIPFVVNAANRRVQLAVELPAVAGEVHAGWAGIKISESPVDNRESLGLPFLAGLAQKKGQGEPGKMTFVQRGELALEPGVLPVPFEQWRYHAGGESQVTVVLDLIPASPDPSLPVSVGLLWYRAGRFEILSEREFMLREPMEMVLDGTMPEPGGAWIGVWMRQPGPDGSGEKARLGSWTYR